MDRRKHHIERLLRKGWSKLGVLGVLSDMNLRFHWLDKNHKEDEIELYEDIDHIFKKIVEEGNHVIAYNKGKNKSPKLFKKAIN